MLPNLIAQLLWFAILATPLISFLFLRRYPGLTIGVRIILGISLTMALTILFYTISITILFSNGFVLD